VHLVEAKVFAALSDEGEKVSIQWVLDTGASNHMRVPGGVL
jgi:predicted aspartyl protease